MTLYITDLDGTLLGPDSRVSGESARIITDLSRRGALITVATARTPATVEPLLHDTLTTIPAIVLTGASMWDRSRRVYLDPMTLAAGSADSLKPHFSVTASTRLSTTSTPTVPCRCSTRRI